MDNREIEYTADRIGYEIFGPFIVGVCHWIHEFRVKKNKQYKRVLFGARDGYYLFEAYKKIYPQESEAEYFYISRKSLRLPMLYLSQEIDTIEKTLRVGGKRKIVDFLGMLSLEELLPRLEESGINGEDFCYPSRISTTPKLEKFLIKNKEMIKNKAGDRYEIAKEYLREHGFDGNDILLIDYGWGGSIQYFLTTIQKNAFGKGSVDALYVGYKKDICEYNEYGTYEGYLNKSDDKAVYEVRKMGNIVERILLADHGTTISFEYDKGKVKPVLDKFEFKSDATLNRIREGMMRYVKEFDTNNVQYKIKSDFYIKELLRLSSKPQKEEIELLGDIDISPDGTFVRKCVALDFTRSINPVKILMGLKKSDWKTGYIAYITGNPKLAEYIYRQYKRLRNDNNV